MDDTIQLPLAPLIAGVSQGAHLTAAEAEGAFNTIMSGAATPEDMSALLVGLNAKGIVPGEIAGGVRALRRAMVVVESERTADLVDTCGTGGGAVTTFNVSTAAALVAAGAGVRIAKHGNRSFTSKSGSADVLEALGVRIELTPAEMTRVLDEVGIVFMFAPLLHPAMRHVGPVRRALAVPTIMNLLGPLTNPAGVRRQVVGVSDPSWVGLVVEALRELGHTRAIVAHGQPGMDELSPSGASHVAELADGVITEREVTPSSAGLEAVDPATLAGGTPERNASLITAVLKGEERGPGRTVTVLNAGAAIWVAGRVDSLQDGVQAARAALDDGRALEKLAALREATSKR